MDSAALHCCSADKSLSDHELQHLHDNLDLLGLLGITEHDLDPFPSPREEREREKAQDTRRKSILQPLPPVPDATTKTLEENTKENFEEEICKPEDRGKEEAEDDNFPARLFTCPAQPFHSRLSVYGEMFP